MLKTVVNGIDIATGWRDTDTEQGAVDTNPVTSDLAMVPFRVAGHEVLGTTAPISNSNITRNADGYGLRVAVSLPAGPPEATEYTRVRFTVHGRRVGVRWSHYYAAPSDDFAVLIDGLTYRVPYRQPVWYDVPLANTIDPYNQWLCPDMLDDGPHAVEIVCQGDTANTLKWDLYGFVAERRRGYGHVPPPLNSLGARTTLTASGVAAVFADASFGYAHSLIFWNVGATAETVTIEWFGSDIWARQLAAGEAYTFEFPGRPPIFGATIKVRASGGTVHCTPVGGYQ